MGPASPTKFCMLIKKGRSRMLTCDVFAVANLVVDNVNSVGNAMKLSRFSSKWMGNYWLKFCHTCLLFLLATGLQNLLDTTSIFGAALLARPEHGISCTFSRVRRENLFAKQTTITNITGVWRPTLPSISTSAPQNQDDNVNRTIIGKNHSSNELRTKSHFSNPRWQT